MLPVSTSSASRRHCSAFENLPAVLHESVASNLTPPDLGAFARVNRHAHCTVQSTLNNVRYLDRLPRYLNSIGIMNKLKIQAVQRQALSVPALFFELKNNRLELLRILNDPHASAMVKMVILNPAICSWLVDGSLAIASLHRLSLFEIVLLSSAQMQEYVFSEKMTVSEVLGLNANEMFILQQRTVKNFIFGGLLSIEQARKFRPSVVINLNHPVVQEYIRGHLLTVQEAAGLTAAQLANLNNWTVQQCINSNLISLTDALNLTARTRGDRKSVV